MTAQLLALGLSDEVPSYVGKGIMALELWIPGGLVFWWVWRRIDSGWKVEAARRGRVSANFRARWPAHRVTTPRGHRVARRLVELEWNRLNLDGVVEGENHFPNP